MGLGGVFQRKALVDCNLHRAGADYREEVVGRGLHFCRRAGVMAEYRARDEERTLGRENRRREGTDRPARVAIRHHDAERLKTIEPRHERVLADGVIDHRHTLAAGQFAHPFFPAQVLGVDHMRAAVGLGQFHFPR